MRIQAKSDTLLKRKLALSSELSEADTVFIPNQTELELEYYIDVGSSHWQIELLKPPQGASEITSWYIYQPDFELLTDISLMVISDTLFKTEPKMSSELGESETLLVKNRTTYKLLSFLPGDNNHTKIELADAVLGPDERKIWYVYTPDVDIEGQRQTLTAVSDTLFKSAPQLSSELPDSDKVFVKNGTTFELQSYSKPEKNHLKVALQGAFLGPHNLTTWYAYISDVAINGNQLDNNPNDSNPAAGGQPANPADPGIPMQFPGFTGTYYTNHPILWTTQYNEQGHFTWGEATHNATRIPQNQDVVYGIIRIAQALEDVRRRFDERPMIITSWYRDPATNAAVGGASQSRHMSGDAVDFYFPDFNPHPYDVYAQLDSWWGARGGLASASVFTHIDARGYRARWSYGY